MREIKFRAWDTVRKKYNREVHVDCYGGIVQFKFNGSSYHEVFDEQESKDRFIIEQYTGIKDRDGNEIYEGDVCDGHSDGVGVIQWTDFDGGYEYVFKDGVSVGIWEVKKNLKIIGNVHENKEYEK